MVIAAAALVVHMIAVVIPVAALVVPPAAVVAHVVRHVTGNDEVLDPVSELVKIEDAITTVVHEPEEHLHGHAFRFLGILRVHFRHIFGWLESFGRAENDHGRTLVVPLHVLLHLLPRVKIAEVRLRQRRAGEQAHARKNCSQSRHQLLLPAKKKAELSQTGIARPPNYISVATSTKRMVMAPSGSPPMELMW